MYILGWPKSFFGFSIRCFALLCCTAETAQYCRSTILQLQKKRKHLDRFVVVALSVNCALLNFFPRAKTCANSEYTSAEILTYHFHFWSESCMGKRSVGCREWDACLGCSAVGPKVYHPLSPRAVSSQIVRRAHRLAVGIPGLILPFYEQGWDSYIIVRELFVNCCHDALKSVLWCQAASHVLWVDNNASRCVRGHDNLNNIRGTLTTS